MSDYQILNQLQTLVFKYTSNIILNKMNNEPAPISEEQRLI